MKKLVIGLGVFVVAVVVFLFYEGVFCSVKVSEQVVGDYWVVCRENVGPYEKVAPVMKKVCEDLKNDGIETNLECGLYYDDPKDVSKENLRSEVGAILDVKYCDRIESLQSKYKVKQLKSRNSLVAEFPIKNVLSFMVGPMKVYPAMDKYCKAKNIDVKAIKDGFGLEIYDIGNKKTTYIMPIE